MSRDGSGLWVSLKTGYICLVRSGWAGLPVAFIVVLVLSPASGDCAVALGVVLGKEELSGPAPEDGTLGPCVFAIPGCVRTGACPKPGIRAGQFAFSAYTGGGWFLMGCAPENGIPAWSPGESAVEAERLPPPHIQYSSENTQ